VDTSNIAFLPLASKFVSSSSLSTAK